MNTHRPLRKAATVAATVAVIALFATSCDNRRSATTETTRTGPSQTEGAAAAPTPAATPEQATTARPTPTPQPAESTTEQPQETATLLRANWRHRDGTSAVLEFAAPKLFRLETTELTLTTDGDLVLAVFPDMDAYATFNAPRTYTFEAFARLSPVLETPLSSYSGRPIPRSATNIPEGWKRADEAPDKQRFSTQPPRFSRDITSQIARPVGEYAARRLEGQPAPYFEVRDLTGNPVTLSDFEGKPMLIDFWATWCPPCLESMPKLDALDQRFADAGLVVLGMNMDEGSGANRLARTFVANHGFSFRQAEAGSAPADFRVEVLPTLFLLDREHIIQRVYIGVPPDQQTLAREIEAVLR